MLNIPNLQENIILAPFTTYKIGGPADFFVEVQNQDELVNAIKQARQNKIPYFVLGTGANILVTDKGFRGLVILNRTNNFEFIGTGQTSLGIRGLTGEGGVQLRADSGAVVANLIDECKARELSGFEHFAGIPSSVGGALWQNLHFLTPDRMNTFYIEAILLEATILDTQNETKKINKDFFQFGYDDSIMHHQEVIVLDATFQLTPKPRVEIQKQIDANLLWRTQKQPQLWEYPSCGSVFKKIEGAGAGRLIQEAGLKGHRIDNIQISTKHANYLINLGGAKAAEVLQMIDLVKNTVKQKLGYNLEPEISIVGER